MLLRAPNEVEGLLGALREGRVDGSTYTGPCACLVGTIANLRGVDVETIDYRNPHRPIERFFLSINRGDTPDTNPVSRIVVEWVEEFRALATASAAQ